MTTVVLDTQKCPGEVRWTKVVAGLTLLERSLRVASVSGASRIVVVTDEAEVGQVRAAISQSRAKIVAEVQTEPIDGDYVALDIWTVYERAGVLERLEGLKPQGRWTVQVLDEASARDAERRLWLDCRKPLDGIVSQHLNRYISLWISSRIAGLGIHPNHISIVTFSLGILAGVLAALGGYWYLLLAGIVFQINSVIDGCDGELARVKYEFSVLGEWLDTISDDLSDVFFWAGLGIGAWRTFDSVVPPTWWLWLAAVAVVFKGVSMALYYTWLYARGRGDLLAFTWSFDSASDDGPLLARVLRVLKYTTKKDFIVFLAMILGFLGALPWLLFAAAIGNIVVAIGVILQRRAKGE